MGIIRGDIIHDDVKPAESQANYTITSTQYTNKKYCCPVNFKLCQFEVYRTAII